MNEVPQVREALAQAGVPAEVTFGSTCTSSALLPLSVIRQVLPPDIPNRLSPYTTSSGDTVVTVVHRQWPPTPS